MAEQEASDPCGIRNLVAGFTELEVYQLHRALFEKFREHEERGDQSCARFYRVLANAASLHLQPHNAAEPLCPMMQLRDRRTSAIEDFDADATSALREVLPQVDHADLRARICDVIWLARRDHGAASLAVSAYIKAALLLEDPDSWPPAMERLERAAQIARSLGRESAALQEVRAAASGMLDRQGGEDPLFLSARLIELLLQIGGRDPDDLWSIASKMAESARAKREWHRAETYREVAASCRSAAGNQEEANRERIEAAEVLVDEASAAAAEASYLVASAHLERAIQGLRRVPGTRERVAELSQTLLEYQKESVKEMKPISVEIETRELTEAAVEQVSGLDWPDAFRALARVSVIPDYKSEEDSAERLVKDHPLQHLFSTTRIDAEGRAVARSPGGGLDDEEGRRAAVRAAMFQNAAFRHSLVGHAVVEPARQAIRSAHEVTAESVVDLLADSPFVPDDRRVAFSRGIAAGFDADYLLASHLLVPQLENAVRRVLMLNGVQVTSLDNRGIQRERDLNYLLYQDSTKEVFTAGVVFDLQALLVDPLGANLRNRLAHGLLPDLAFGSAEAAYLWWVVIFLVEAFRVVEQDAGSG